MPRIVKRQKYKYKYKYINIDANVMLDESKVMKKDCLPFTNACWFGYDEIAKVLIDYGISMKESGGYGLYKAVESRRIRIVELILQYDNIDISICYDKIINSNYFEIIYVFKQWLLYKAIPEIKQKYDCQPLIDRLKDIKIKQIIESDRKKLLKVCFFFVFFYFCFFCLYFCFVFVFCVVFVSVCVCVCMCVFEMPICFCLLSENSCQKVLKNREKKKY